MASPVKTAKSHHQARGFTEVSGRGKGSLKSKKPGLEQYAVTAQAGSAGWHFGDGPYTSDHEVDTALVASVGQWSHEMTLADYNAFLQENFSLGQVARYLDPVSGEDVTFQPQQLQWTNDNDQIEPIGDPQVVIGTVNDDRITWVDAYGAGIDFTWFLDTARLKKLLNLNNPLSAPPQFILDGGNPVLRLQFILELSAGVEVWIDGEEYNLRNNTERNTSGDIEFRSSSGDLLWRFVQPYAIDANASILNTSYRMRVRANDVFIEVRVPWSDLETASYPVTIDPTVDPQAASGDEVSEAAAGAVASGTNRRLNSSLPYAGARWTSVEIEGTIDVAYQQIYGDHPALIEYDGDMDFVDEDSAGAWSTGGTSDVSDRTLTGNAVGVDITLNTSAFTNTPSLVTPLQAVVDRGGWSSGNNLATVCTHDTVADENAQYSTYADSSSEAQILHVEYTSGGAAPDYTVSVIMHHRKNLGFS